MSEKSELKHLVCHKYVTGMTRCGSSLRHSSFRVARGARGSQSPQANHHWPQVNPWCTPYTITFCACQPWIKLGGTTTEVVAEQKKLSVTAQLPAHCNPSSECHALQVQNDGLLECGLNYRILIQFTKKKTLGQLSGTQNKYVTRPSLLTVWKTRNWITRHVTIQVKGKSFTSNDRRDFFFFPWEDICPCLLASPLLGLQLCKYKIIFIKVRKLSSLSVGLQKTKNY